MMRRTLLIFMGVHCLLSWGQVVEVDAGNGHALMLTKEGKVWTVGRNDHGQLGNNSYFKQQKPVELKLSQIVTIARGYDHSLAIDRQGQLWGWGNNDYGQLGIAGQKDILTPVKYKGTLSFSKCEGGYNHTLLLDSEGKVWARGNNDSGQLGNGSLKSSTALVAVQLKNQKQLSSIQQIAAVGEHSLALDSSGQVYAWGANFYGEVAPNEVDKKVVYAIPVHSADNMQSIAAGWGHSVALSNQGDVYVWGARPETYSDNVPVESYPRITKMKQLPAIEKIACGSWHSLAIDKEGNAWSWGRNMFGMLGDGTVENRSTPVLMKNVSAAKHIGGGCFQSLIVDENGTIKTCGDNGFGQLGIGNRERKLTPVAITFTNYNRDLNLSLLAGVGVFICGIAFVLVRLRKS